MLRAAVWWRDASSVYATGVQERRAGAELLGVSVLDDEGVIRAWEVMQAQVGSGLVPNEAAQAWIEGLPFES